MSSNFIRRSPCSTSVRRIRPSVLKDRVSAGQIACYQDRHIVCQRQKGPVEGGPGLARLGYTCPGQSASWEAEIGARDTRSAALEPGQGGSQGGRRPRVLLVAPQPFFRVTGTPLSTLAI